jgi:Transposase DDE domain
VPDNVVLYVGFLWGQRGRPQTRTDRLVGILWGRPQAEVRRPGASTTADHHPAPRDLAQAQAAARPRKRRSRFQADYARRAGVKGTMHQASSHGARRARHRGLPKSRLDHVYMACALNLLRLQAFWTASWGRQPAAHSAS